MMRMLVRAVILGLGVELGREIYRVVKERVSSKSDDCCCQNSPPVEGGEEPSAKSGCKSKGNQKDESH